MKLNVIKVIHTSVTGSNTGILLFTVYSTCNIFKSFIVKIQIFEKNSVFQFQLKGLEKGMVDPLGPLTDPLGPLEAPLGPPTEPLGPPWPFIDDLDRNQAVGSRQ